MVGKWWAVEGADCRKYLLCKGLGAVDLAIVDYLLCFWAGCRLVLMLVKCLKVWGWLAAGWFSAEVCERREAVRVLSWIWLAFIGLRAGAVLVLMFSADAG